MTGFLCALGGVLLQKKEPNRQGNSDGTENKKMFGLSSSSQDVQYCPVTQYVYH